MTFVSFALLATGFILFFSDRMARGRKTERTATVLDALLVGCAQALGTLPGISRSGITISAGMLRGYDRTFAVRFSFLIDVYKRQFLGRGRARRRLALLAGAVLLLLAVWLGGGALLETAGLGWRRWVSGGLVAAAAIAAAALALLLPRELHTLLPGAESLGRICSCLLYTSRCV